MASGGSITLAKFYREVMKRFDKNDKLWEQQFKFNKLILKRIDNIVKKNNLKE